METLKNQSVEKSTLAALHKEAIMGTRIQHWNKIEAASKALLETMERAARDPAWRDEDLARWDDLYSNLTNRPKLSLAEIDAR